MYKVILISLLGILSFGFGKYPKQLPGYAIDRQSGDTLQIIFKVNITKKKLEFIRNRESLEIVNSIGGKTYLEPKAVTEVGIRFEGRTTKLCSRENTVDIHPLSLDYDGFLFFEVEEDGPVKLLSFPESTYSASGAGAGAVGGGIAFTEHTQFLQYQNYPLVRVKRLHFKRDMADFFAEVPDLVERIEANQVGYNDLPQLVQQYNKYLNSRTFEPSSQVINGF